MLKLIQSFFRASEKIPLCGDPSKIKNIIGWENSKSLESIIQEILDNELRKY